MEKITIERLPAIIVASHRTTIPSFEDLGPGRPGEVADYHPSSGT